MALAELTRMPGWSAMEKMMDVWKQRVMVKALQNTVTDKDISSMQGQCKAFAYIKNLPKRLKEDKPAKIEGTNDPADTIEI